MMGLTELLKDDIETFTSEELKEFIDNLSSSIKSQLNLLENLFNWSQLQIGNIEFIKEEINLKELTQEVFNLVKWSATPKEITIINSINENICLTADKNMIRSILYNLLFNAIKFTEKTGSIFVKAVEINNQYEITVEDTGVGMSKDAVKKILDPGFKVSTSGTNGEKGTGLGLNIVKEMVEKHNGKIRIESEIKKGTKITFIIPR